jgi:hypothetical protein
MELIMNDIIWQRIENKRLKVNSKYKETAKKVFTNFGRQRQEFSKFGPFYELYLYCFTLGFHANRRVFFKKSKCDTFNTISEMRNANQTIFKNLLIVLICHDDIRQETGFDFYEMDSLDKKEIFQRTDNLIQVFEEYANGGFSILLEAYDSNPNDFHDFRSLYAFFDEIVTKSKI